MNPDHASYQDEGHSRHEHHTAILITVGVEPIDTKDKDFDVNYHEAVTMIPSQSDEQKGKVVDCINKGYMLNDKVIRFAKVVVAN